ncbi:hypothetical protein [Flavobacterium lotistagni]|uniref:hypothetical protein n=1 Tax=Flavobacterium lotistagni TaxID=2709660 RepID=UPI001A9C5161|nr:hypothetical protein [Flavobacterium lotistagni]
MALKIWLAIYPSITLFLYFFGAIMGALPLPVKTLIITLFLVPWVVFVGLPLVDYLMNKTDAKQRGSKHL